MKSLHELYVHGKVKKNQTLTSSGEIGFLLNSAGVLYATTREIWATAEYEKFYDNHYKATYESCKQFLERENLLKPQTRFEDDDIRTLMKIRGWSDSGVLNELRGQIISNDESLRGVSQMFFRNEKYLDDKASLVQALKQILGVEQFANEKDQQYIYKLECHNPSAVILCENLDFLTKPNKPRQYGVELWYAGGKNIDKLHYSETRGLPIFYSCDWDYDGLFIIYPLVKKIISSIQLLFPSGLHKSIVQTRHKSTWSNIEKIALLLGNGLFLPWQTTLVKTLVAEDSWIIEESNDLSTMLQQCLEK